MPQSNVHKARIDSPKSIPAKPTTFNSAVATQEKEVFFKYLSPNISEYKFSGIQKMKELISEQHKHFMSNNNMSDSVIFTHISPEEVEKFKEDILGRIDYSILLQTLIIKMLSLPHEVAADGFNALIITKAKEMSVLRLLLLRGATAARTPKREKQADRSWGPKHISNRSPEWPTVALEVAFSQSREQVKRDMMFWLYESQGDVLLGITIDIKRPSGNIYITSWDRGIMPTRQHPSPGPKALSETKILRGQGHNGLPHITGHDLIIPFRTMLLRAPTQGEKDFVITKEEMLDLAQDVWYAMDETSNLT